MSLWIYVDSVSHCYAHQPVHDGTYASAHVSFKFSILTQNNIGTCVPQIASDIDYKNLYSKF